MSALIAAIGIVAAPAPLPAQAEDGHPYTTPGEREYNGRKWKTTCEPYSSTVQRCRAEIFATQARIVKGQYTLVNEYVFNNLTYLPSPRANWKGNPLAKNGQFTGTDGRFWKTECDTAATGRNGCRSYTYTTVIDYEKVNGAWKFSKVNKWVFNNVVQFKATPPDVITPDPTYDNPCNAPAPAGWAFTKDGRPHVIKTPYTPNTHYNPISLSNFIKVSLRSTTLSDADRTCFALLAANHLVSDDGVKTRTYEGRKSLWLPYPFEFSANPGIPSLKSPWHSGLGQAGALTAMLELAKFTGDNTWNTYAEQLYNSYLIPLDQGGFTDRDNGFLWFEEYPTDPPTTVYNGHFQAVLALYAWASSDYAKKNTDTTEAWALFEEAIKDLAHQVPLMKVPVEGGTMSSYDMVRGYPATPLRAIPVDGSSPTITATLLNDAPLKAQGGSATVRLPVGATTAPAANLITNPGMNYANGSLTGWTIVNNNRAGVTFKDGWVGVHPTGKAWAGVEQTIPAGKFPAGATMSFAMNSRLQIPEGAAGTGGKVSIYSVCNGTTTLIHENAKNRSRQAAWSSSEFKAPAAGCSIKLQLLTFSYTVTNTTAWYDDIAIRTADPLGANVKPAYDLLVHRSPTNTLTVKGTGKAQVQAWYGGRWLNVGGPLTLSASGADVVIPERYTGRNINYNYHDGHVSELGRLAAYAADRKMPAEAALFDETSYILSRMSAGTPYKPLNPKTIASEPIIIDTLLGAEEIAASPKPLKIQPQAVPTSMDLTDEQR